MDYDFEQTSVTFLPGETTVRFNVTIINDDVSDGNEYLMLEITDATGAFLGFPRFSSITILDDDTITGVNGKLLASSYTCLNTHSSFIISSYSNVNSLYRNYYYYYND